MFKARAQRGCTVTGRRELVHACCCARVAAVSRPSRRRPQGKRASRVRCRVPKPALNPCAHSGTDERLRTAIVQNFQYEHTKCTRTPCSASAVVLGERKGRRVCNFRRGCSSWPPRASSHPRRAAGSTLTGSVRRAKSRAGERACCRRRPPRVTSLAVRRTAAQQHYTQLSAAGKLRCWGTHHAMGALLLTAAAVAMALRGAESAPPSALSFRSLLLLLRLLRYTPAVPCVRQAGRGYCSGMSVRRRPLRRPNWRVAASCFAQDLCALTC